MALCRARVARCALAAGLPAPQWTGDVKRGSIELRLRPRVAARDMSLPTPHRSLSPARLVRAAGRLQHTERPLVFESKISAQLAGLILYAMHMLV